MIEVVVGAATPWGTSALAVVRLSGTDLISILEQFTRPLSAGPWTWGRPQRVVVFDEGGEFDDGILLLGQLPHTYTGENTAEISVHGNPRIVQRLLNAAVSAGARLADPGEFTRRAWLNGKIDLVAAEAILQIATASSDEGIRIARDGISGGLSQEIQQLRRMVISLAADLEARLDYPEDELAFFSDEQVITHAKNIATSCRELAGTWTQARRWLEGARIALVGAVNAGKSSLFNALVGRDRALVHATPGTTRDVLEVVCSVDGIQVTLLDTAGERETEDPIEAAGLALAQELIADVDLLLIVLRARPEGISEAEQAILNRTSDRPRLIVYNGVDRLGVASPPPEAISTVAIRHAGIETLQAKIRTALVGSETQGSQRMISSIRQRDVLLTAATALEEAVAGLVIAGPAVAVDGLTRGIAAFDELTGADTREDILDALFAKFCIGK